MVKYDQDFIKSDIGKELYSKWSDMKRKAGRCEEWDDFNAFCVWAFDQGFIRGAFVRRRDKHGLYTPENCYLITGKKIGHNIDPEDFINRWNKTVNRIRIAYGMEPLRKQNSTKTCKDCKHYVVCKYKAENVPVCEDFLG